MPEQLSLQDQLHVRLQEKLRRELGAGVLDALADPRVIEVMLNPDGHLWIDELGVGMRDTGAQISAAQAENLLGTVAATLGCVITPERPVLEGELHLDGSRFCGLLPPVVLAPTFWLAGGFYLLRMLAQRVGLPLRQSYVMGVASPEERGAVGALANLPSQATSAASPTLAGYLFDHVALALPFEIGAILQGVNTALFFLFFHAAPPPEERAKTTHGK